MSTPATPADGDVCAFHQVADIWAPGYVVSIARGQRVTLSGSLRAFLEFARKERERAVLVTDRHASLSPHLAEALQSVGGVWVVAQGRRYFDGVSGFQLPSLEAATTADRLTDRLPEYGAVPQGLRPAWIFDITVEHRLTRELTLGGLAETMVRGLGGLRLDRCDFDEPLTEHWSRPEVTARLRKAALANTDGARMLAASPDGSWASVAAVNLRSSFVEHARGGVLVSDVDQRDDSEIAVATLRRVASDYRTMIGILSRGLVGESATGPARQAAARPADSTVAVVVGPGAVKDLRLDVATLRMTTEVTLLGPGRAPTVLIQPRGETDLMAVLRSYAHDMRLRHGGV